MHNTKTNHTLRAFFMGSALFVVGTDLLPATPPDAQAKHVIIKEQNYRRRLAHCEGLVSNLLVNQTSENIQAFMKSTSCGISYAGDGMEEAIAEMKIAPNTPTKAITTEQVNQFLKLLASKQKGHRIKSDPTITADRLIGESGSNNFVHMVDICRQTVSDLKGNEREIELDSCIAEKKSEERNMILGVFLMVSLVIGSLAAIKTFSQGENRQSLPLPPPRRHS